MGPRRDRLAPRTADDKRKADEALKQGTVASSVSPTGPLRSHPAFSRRILPQNSSGGM
jgi:hypothetical protein